MLRHEHLRRAAALLDADLLPAAGHVVPHRRVRDPFRPVLPGQPGVDPPDAVPPLAQRVQVRPQPSVDNLLQRLQLRRTVARRLGRYRWRFLLPGMSSLVSCLPDNACLLHGWPTRLEDHRRVRHSLLLGTISLLSNLPVSHTARLQSSCRAPYIQACEPSRYSGRPRCTTVTDWSAWRAVAPPSAYSAAGGGGQSGLRRPAQRVCLGGAPACSPPCRRTCPGCGALGDADRDTLLRTTARRLPDAGEGRPGGGGVRRGAWAVARRPVRRPGSGPGHAGCQGATAGAARRGGGGPGVAARLAAG